MGAKFGITFDSADPRGQATFWAAVLGERTVSGPDPGEDGAGEWALLEDLTGTGPSVYFQKVPETKVAKNRMHLDIEVGGDGPLDQRRARIDAEVERLKALGATDHRGSHAEGRSYWVRMNDPEGNEFCLV